MTASVKLPLGFASAVPTPAQLQQPKFRLGQRGEQLAANFLKSKNYQLIARNVRWKQLEIDVIAIDPETNEVCFVEVKTRSSSYLPATAAISNQKQQALIRAARIYQLKTSLEQAIRIDVITIQQGKIDHYQNISWWK